MTYGKGFTERTATFDREIEKWILSRYPCGVHNVHVVSHDYMDVLVRHMSRVARFLPELSSQGRNQSFPPQN